MTVLLEYSAQSYRRAKGNYRFRVDTDGAVRVQQNRTDLLDHHGWADGYPAQPLATFADAEPRLLARLEQDGFFALAALGDAPRREGSLQILAWYGPRARTLRVDRAALPAFDALIGHLVRELAIDQLLAA
ncbi:MAG: hypothetical protein ABIY55_12945 [Kofleriaceae bacterium]